MKPLLSFLFLTLCHLAVAQTPDPEYLAFYNPAKGFRPAQRNLTEIYLQIAGSLEASGSPEPYLRHMQAEHARIAALTGISKLPARMTDQYIDKLVANWNKLSPLLGLDELTKKVGHDVRNGIRGTRLHGTVLVALFNDYQDRLAADLATPGARKVSFQTLRDKITTEMQLDVPDSEFNLHNEYINRRDALSYALVLRGRFITLNQRLEKSLPPEKASLFLDAIKGAFIDLAEMGHSELEAAILEYSVR